MPFPGPQAGAGRSCVLFFRALNSPPARPWPALSHFSVSARLNSSLPDSFFLPVFCSLCVNRRSLVFLFRQLRSFRCFRSFVGSHISAFNFCKSQSRERVSQSNISLKRAMAGSALTRASTKEHAQPALGPGPSASAAGLDKPPVSSKSTRRLRPSAGPLPRQLSGGSSCA